LKGEGFEENQGFSYCDGIQVQVRKLEDGKIIYGILSYDENHHTLSVSSSLRQLG
jgi:hypothetical protein